MLQHIGVGVGGTPSAREDVASRVAAFPDPNSGRQHAIDAAMRLAAAGATP